MGSMTRYKTIAYEVEIPKTIDGFRQWEFTSGSTTGEDFNIFARLFKKHLQSALPRNAAIVKWNRGHYYVSGFVSKDGKFVYFSTSDVRYFPGAWHQDILIRTAKSDQDYTGGSNGSSSLEDFGQRVGELLART